MSIAESPIPSAIPDSLDLVARARLGLQGMAGILDPGAGYEFWFGAIYNANPAYMYRDARSFPACGPKLLEAFPMLMTMTGSSDHGEVYEGLKRTLVSWIDPDGIMYTPVGPSRPWDTVCPEDYCNVYGQARMMLAIMAMHKRDGNPDWLELLGRLSDGLAGLAIDKGEYAYYPENPGNGTIVMGEGYCHPRSGWYRTDEADSEVEGVEGSLFMYHCAPIRALARWHRMSGDERAIRTARKLVRYVMQDRFWGCEHEWPRSRGEKTASEGYHKDFPVFGPDRGHFTGHLHGHTAMFLALIEYADAVNDTHIKEFVRAGYEYARNLGIARVGLFGEACAVSDMIAVAIRLSDTGVGDYWGDVDGYVRNQLVEQQLLDADELRRISESGPAAPRHPHSCRDRVIERTIGLFANLADLGQIPVPWSAQCCTGNALQALYLAWEGIVREVTPDHVQVNLLLNRVSPWLDLVSSLPREGRVTVRNKTARVLSLRLPLWVDRTKVICSLNGNRSGFTWAGRYAVLAGLTAGDEVQFEFPVKEETASYTVIAKQAWSNDPSEEVNAEGSSITYTCRFRGDTLMDFSPRPDGRWYPLYRRVDGANGRIHLSLPDVTQGELPQPGGIS